MKQDLKFFAVAMAAFVLGMGLNNFAMSGVPANYKVAVVDVQKVISQSSQVAALKKDQQGVQIRGHEDAQDPAQGQKAEKVVALYPAVGHQLFPGGQGGAHPEQAGQHAEKELQPGHGKIQPQTQQAGQFQGAAFPPEESPDGSHGAQLNQGGKDGIGAGQPEKAAGQIADKGAEKGKKQQRKEKKCGIQSVSPFTAGRRRKGSAGGKDR